LLEVVLIDNASPSDQELLLRRVETGATVICSRENPLRGRMNRCPARTAEAGRRRPS
jgi:hypothetical protein